MTAAYLSMVYLMHQPPWTLFYMVVKKKKTANVKGIGTKQSLRSLPVQIIQWLYVGTCYWQGLLLRSLCHMPK